MLVWLAADGRRFVYDQPVKSQLSYRFSKLVKGYRLADIAIAPQTVARQDILLLS